MLNQLKHIGLSENEAKTYLAMLELGPSPVLEIAAKAGINRPTAYVQIEFLKKRGLVSTQTKGKKQLFIAEDPSQLEIIVSEEEKEIEHKKDELERVLPDLRTLFDSSGDRPHVRFFEGKEGLERMQTAFLESKEKTAVSISSGDDIMAVFPDHPKAYSPRRVTKGIKTRLIYTSSQGRILKEHDQELLRDAIYVSPEEFNFHADIVVFDDKISISALRGKISGIIIQHRELADSFKAIFELLWKSLDRK